MKLGSINVMLAKHECLSMYGGVQSWTVEITAPINFSY